MEVPPRKSGLTNTATSGRIVTSSSVVVRLKGPAEKFYSPNPKRVHLSCVAQTVHETADSTCLIDQEKTPTGTASASTSIGIGTAAGGITIDPAGNNANIDRVDDKNEPETTTTALQPTASSRAQQGGDEQDPQETSSGGPHAHPLRLFAGQLGSNATKFFFLDQLTELADVSVYNVDVSPRNMVFFSVTGEAEVQRVCAFSNRMKQLGCDLYYCTPDAVSSEEAAVAVLEALPKPNERRTGRTIPIQLSSRSHQQQPSLLLRSASSVSSSSTASPSCTGSSTRRSSPTDGSASNHLRNLSCKEESKEKAEGPEEEEEVASPGLVGGPPVEVEGTGRLDLPSTNATTFPLPSSPPLASSSSSSWAHNPYGFHAVGH